MSNLTFLGTEKEKQKNNQGVFYIDIKNFSKYFSHLDVCMYIPHWRYESYRVEGGRLTMLSIDVKRRGTYHFTLLQKNRRFFRK
jgi:hypothetical protein